MQTLLLRIPESYRRKYRKNIDCLCNLFVIIAENTRFACISWWETTNDSYHLKGLHNNKLHFKKPNTFFWVFRWLQIVQNVSVWTECANLIYHSKESWPKNSTTLKPIMFLLFSTGTENHSNHSCPAWIQALRWKELSMISKPRWCISYFFSN